MYIPNQASDFADKRFILDRAVPDAKIAERGVTAIQAYNMFPLDQRMRETYEQLAGFTCKERFFNSSDNAEFEAGFAQCILEHLLRMWAAGHPPAPKSAIAEGFKPGEARKNIEKIHRSNQAGKELKDYKLTSITSLFGHSDTNISDEYFSYKKMADKYGITDIKYISEAAETHKMHYAAPLGRAGESLSLSEWTSMSAADYAEVRNAQHGVKAQHDRIVYTRKLLTRTCQPIPFAAVNFICIQLQGRTKTW